MAEAKQPITGKVAEILNRYTLAINRGSEDGVEVGMIFAVMGLGGEIIDPETKKPLGPRPIEKLRVKVTDVYEKFCVAETYRIVTPQSLHDLVGGFGARAAAEIAREFGAAGMPPGPERERVAGAPEPGETKPTSAVVSVKIGDMVRQMGRIVR